MAKFLHQFYHQFLSVRRRNLSLENPIQINFLVNFKLFLSKLTLIILLSNFALFTICYVHVVFDCRLIQLCLQTFKLTLHIHLQCLNELPHLFLSLLIINVLICLILSVWFCGGDCWGCLLLVMHHAILKDSNLFIGKLHKARACIILRLGLQKLILLRINSRILDHFLASLLLVI